MDKIVIKGARENNLKNISLELPKNKLIVMTGLSGCGKSSLAFDTIYQEGQRRFVESLSSYARQFIGGLEKPDVDSIEGLSPAISIDQKSTNHNPRSTVGTVTEIYDYLRVLYSRIGIPHCPTHHMPISSFSNEQIINKILELPLGSRLYITSPVVFREKGEHKATIDKYIKEGFNIDEPQTRASYKHGLDAKTQTMENKFAQFWEKYKKVHGEPPIKQKMYECLNSCKTSKSKSFFAKSKCCLTIFQMNSIDF